MIDKKKILIILIFLTAIILFSWLLWYVFFRGEPQPALPDVDQGTTEEQVRLPESREKWEQMSIEERGEAGLPLFEWEDQQTQEVIDGAEDVLGFDNIAQGGKTWINPVSDFAVQGAELATDGRNSVYYDPSSGYFFQADYLGNKTKLTEQRFFNVQDINWAPTKDRAILEYPDGFKVMYDFDRGKQYTLPRNWEDFSWDPAGSRIAFKSTSQYEENNWLAIARPDGSQTKPIEHMGRNADKVTISWSPNDQVIAFSATGEPRSSGEQEILLIGQHGENFKSLVVDGRGFEPSWAPTGERIAYSVYSGQNNYLPRLYLVDAQGENIGNNKIDTGLTTWAHKCTFTQNGGTMYCAVPRNLPEGSGLMPELAGNTRDDFYQVDVQTGRISFLAEGAMGGYNVSKIYLSADGSYLYFQEASSGKLRYIKLK